MILKCQCCGIEQEFADGEVAFRAGWDAPPHFTQCIVCNLCPATCIVMGLRHTKAHALWKREGRPEEFDFTKCASDRDWKTRSLVTGDCPACGCREFIHGPSAGISRNYGCTGCGAWYNVAIWMGVAVFVHEIERGARPGQDAWPRGPLPVKAPAQEPAAECSPRRPR